MHSSVQGLPRNHWPTERKCCLGRWITLNRLGSTQKPHPFQFPTRWPTWSLCWKCCVIILLTDILFYEATKIIYYFSKKYPEEELQELFPENNGELGSENFSPSWFLLRHHHSTSFDDLKAGRSFLKRRVEAQKEGQISFLKVQYLFYKWDQKQNLWNNGQFYILYLRLMQVLLLNKWILW